MFFQVALFLQQHLESFYQVAVVGGMISIYVLTDLWNCEEIGDQANNFHKGFHIGFLLHCCIVPCGHADPHFLHLALSL